MDMKKSDLIKVVNKLSPKMKSELCYGLVDALFESYYDYDFDQMDNVIEVIENVTDLENLQVILHE
jgi:hypothetical protein